jgi:hypothetical protein
MDDEMAAKAAKEDLLKKVATMRRAQQAMRFFKPVTRFEHMEKTVCYARAGDKGPHSACAHVQT